MRRRCTPSSATRTTSRAATLDCSERRVAASRATTRVPTPWRGHMRRGSRVPSSSARLVVFVKGADATSGWAAKAETRQFVKGLVLRRPPALRPPPALQGHRASRFHQRTKSLAAWWLCGLPKVPCIHRTFTFPCQRRESERAGRILGKSVCRCCTCRRARVSEPASCVPTCCIRNCASSDRTLL